MKTETKNIFTSAVFPLVFFSHRELKTKHVFNSKMLAKIHYFGIKSIENLQFWSNIEILVTNRNFDQKCWSMIDILVKIKMLSKIVISVNDRNFRQILDNKFTNFSLYTEFRCSLNINL